DLLRQYVAGRDRRHLRRAGASGQLRAETSMSVTRAFCTDHAIAQQEPLAGTGAMAARHLFVRWPKGKWRRPRYESADLEHVLQRAIHESYGSDRYVGLIESDGRPDLELISFPDSRTAQPASQQEAAAMIRAWASGTPL